MSIGGNKAQAGDRRRKNEVARVFEGCAVGRRQDVVDGACRRGLATQADPAGHVGLRIGIYQQDLLAGTRERSGEINSRCGFADPTLLV